jgi:hypothetical protein
MKINKEWHLLPFEGKILEEIKKRVKDLGID